MTFSANAISLHLCKKKKNKAAAGELQSLRGLAHKKNVSSKMSTCLICYCLLLYIFDISYDWPTRLLLTFSCVPWPSVTWDVNYSTNKVDTKDAKRDCNIIF